MTENRNGKLETSKEKYEITNNGLMNITESNIQSINESKKILGTK